MSQMLTNNQTTRNGPGSGKPVAVAMAISWPVGCAVVAVSSACAGDRLLASVRWRIDGETAYPTGVDVDGRECSVGEAVAVRTVRHEDLIHIDSVGDELHVTVRAEADGTKRMLFVATSLLATLRIAGGRAEWPELVAG